MKVTIKENILLYTGLACVLFSAATRSLMQDYLGEQAYIEMIRAHWVSAWITVPIAGVMLLVGAWLFYKAVKQCVGLVVWAEHLTTELVTKEEDLPNVSEKENV